MCMGVSVCVCVCVLRLVGWGGVGWGWGGHTMQAACVCACMYTGFCCDVVWESSEICSEITLGRPEVEVYVVMHSKCS